MPSASEPEVIERVRVREVVGTIYDRELLDRMVSALTSAGFDRSDIDLMAGRDVVLSKLRTVYVDPLQMAEVSSVPRRELVTRDEDVTVTGLVFGTLISIAALGTALPVVASGGALAAAIAASAGGGLAGAGLAQAVRRFLMKDVDPATLESDIRAGGLVVFVRVRHAAAEAQAQEIMRRHGAQNVHVHEIELQKSLDELPLARVQPDPWLAE